MTAAAPTPTKVAPRPINVAIAITMGDPAGIGPEIIAKAFLQAPLETRHCFVVGDVATLRRACALVAKDHIGLPTLVLDTVDQALNLPEKCLPVLQVGELSRPVKYGEISGFSGKISAQCVIWAANAALRGEVAAIVTAPLHKEALAMAGAPHNAFPGHTEMLQALAAAHGGKTVAQMPVRMMLANDELRVVLVSIHMALSEALAAVTFDRVLQTLQIAHQSLWAMLGHAPRIGVAGLNPHAGEGGRFGREEFEVIAPAIAAARTQGINASGPFAPDTVFMRARHTPAKPGEFDVVIAMYHDQGLIPVKYLGVEKGVNVTLGLPLVRTSPDHGTAFDIAGLGIADPSSLIESIRMARKLAAQN